MDLYAVEVDWAARIANLPDHRADGCRQYGVSSRKGLPDGG